MTDTIEQVAEEARFEARGVQTKGIIDKALADATNFGDYQKLHEFIQEAIGTCIKTEVNGKIDYLQKGMDEHIKVCLPAIENYVALMARITPALEAFETGQRDLASAKKGGKVVLWLAGTVTAIGGAVLVVRQIFWN